MKRSRDKSLKRNKDKFIIEKCIVDNVHLMMTPLADLAGPGDPVPGQVAVPSATFRAVTHNTAPVS